VAQLLEGAAVPVGGEAQSAIRIKSPGEEQQGKGQKRQPVTA
jgi:hypothetical protein